MTTVIDTDVIVALWDRDTRLNSAAQSALDAAPGRGGLIIAAPVFAELMACPGRDQAFLDMFFQDAGIAIDWNLERQPGGQPAGRSRLTPPAAEGRANQDHAAFSPTS